MKIEKKNTTNKWVMYQAKPTKKGGWRVKKNEATFQEVLEKAMYERELIERVNARRMK